MSTLQTAFPAGFSDQSFIGPEVDVAHDDALGVAVYRIFIGLFAFFVLTQGKRG